MDIQEVILEELRAHRTESNARHVEMDKRVRNIENWQSDANGKITMFGAFGTALGAFIVWVVSIFKH